MERGKMTRWTLTALAFCLVAGFSSGVAQDAATPPATGGAVSEEFMTPDMESMNLIWIQEGNVLRVGYVVQTGDTMWDIARRYLNSPYYWPKIWERNSAVVINPHLIFPGDVLYLYPDVIVQKVAQEIEETTDFGPVVQKKEIEWKRQGTTGFVSTDEFDKAGKIIDNYHHKVLLGDGDVVYVNVGKQRNKVLGEKFGIFRLLKDQSSGDLIEVMHPVTGELIGYQIVNLGVLELTKVESDVSEAKIVESLLEIQNGDLITPFTEPLIENVPLVDTNKESIKGYIIASKNSVKLIGERDVVYLDVGRRRFDQAEDNSRGDLVVPGNVFHAYKPCEIIPDGTNSESVRIPEKIIATLVVVEVYDRTSVAVVVKASQELLIGDRVLMSRYNRWEIEGVSTPAEVDSCRNDDKCMVITAEKHDQGVESPYCEISRGEEKGKAREDRHVLDRFKANKSETP